MHYLGRCMLMLSKVELSRNRREGQGPRPHNTMREFWKQRRVVCLRDTWSVYSGSKERVGNRKEGSLAKVNELMWHPGEQTKPFSVFKGNINMFQFQLRRCDSPPQGRESFGWSPGFSTASLLASTVTMLWLSISLDREKPQRKILSHLMTSIQPARAEGSHKM